MTEDKRKKGIELNIMENTSYAQLERKMLEKEKSKGQKFEEEGRLKGKVKEVRFK